MSRVPIFVNDARKPLPGRGQAYSERLTELAEVPLRAIDERGKGRLTDWERAIIDEVISRRSNAMRCTLATTNHEPGPRPGCGT